MLQLLLSAYKPQEIQTGSDHLLTLLVLDTNKYIPAVEPAPPSKINLVDLAAAQTTDNDIGPSSSTCRMTQSLQQLNYKATATRLSFLHMSGTNWLSAKMESSEDGVDHISKWYCLLDSTH